MKVLIVEDSLNAATRLKDSIYKKCKLESIIASSYKECEKILEESKDEISLALLDVNLPDAPNGEIVDFVLSCNVPSVVIAPEYNAIQKEKMMSKEIVDYCINDGAVSIELISDTIKRVVHNYNTKVMIVDDSKVFRVFGAELMERYKLNVLEAKDGVEALEIFENNPDIKIVLTDYIMPNMDGLELTKRLRYLKKKDSLSIIVMSSQDDKEIPSRFLKLGANDFLYKPFSAEEFYARLNSNLELLELFAESKERAERDFLTNLYNRLYFFEMSRKVLANAKRRGTTIAVAMIDIDFFKKINDNYGHDVGDIAIKEMASILDSSFRESDIVARFGGEEFCILLVDCQKSNLFEIFDTLRARVERNKIRVDFKNLEINYTISIGVSAIKRTEIEEMISDADRLLYEAKNSGRNRVVLDKE